jgi:hypothetical protein
MKINVFGLMYKIPTQPITVKMAISGLLRTGIAIFVLETFSKPSCAQQGSPVPRWDFDLPALELKHVHIEANSLQKAWKKFSADYGLRSVLVISEDSGTNGRFQFDKEVCNVKEVYDALVATFPAFTWTQDDNTGITWFYPTGTVYTGLLKSKVTLADDELGIPMQAGFLEPLCKNESLNVRVKEWDEIFQNTFNYPVNIPRGTYSVRELLNLCCLANPSKTFFIVQYSRGFTVVRASNLVVSDNNAPSRGSLHLWELEIGKLPGRAPTDDEIIDALGHRDARVRWAAKMYLEANIWRCPWEIWAREAVPTERALWAILGIQEMLVRAEGASFKIGINRMKDLCTEEFLMKADPQLATLAAFELARVAKDTRAMDIILKRKIVDSELVAVKPELCRMCRQSGLLRDKLMAESSGWAGFSKDKVKKLQQSPFSSPTSTVVP